MDETPDPARMNHLDAQAQMRELLEWARARTAITREDPVMSRAYAMVARHLEDALRVMLLPVP